MSFSSSSSLTRSAGLLRSRLAAKAPVMSDQAASMRRRSSLDSFGNASANTRSRWSMRVRRSSRARPSNRGCAGLPENTQMKAEVSA